MWEETYPDSNLPLSLSTLPPEVLEHIFGYLAHDITALRNVSAVTTLFRQIVSRVRKHNKLICLHSLDRAFQVGVTVDIPLSQENLSWLRKYNVPVFQLNNCEISAFVGDQILGLNLRNCKGTSLVGYDYQSRRCEVTPHYLNIIYQAVSRSSTMLYSSRRSP